MLFGRLSAITCVARMCAQFGVPQPNASAPSPPTVEAWLVRHRQCVAPGSTMPISGATTCEMPCSGSPRSNTRMPFLTAATRGMARRKGAPSGLLGVRAARPRRDRVILHREGEVGPAHRAALLLERTRRHVARAARAARGDRYRSARGHSIRFATKMGVPDFLEQGLGHGLLDRVERCSFSLARILGRATRDGKLGCRERAHGPSAPIRD